MGLLYIIMKVTGVGNVGQGQSVCTQRTLMAITMQGLIALSD